MQLFVDHVALLVRDLEQSLAQIRDLDVVTGPIEEFPGEGTREVYVGAEAHSARLLFIQPLGDHGPYARAMLKRGPGLHHIAVAMPEPLTCADHLPGWLVHPASLGGAGQELWLARPGVPCLLELNAGSVVRTAPVVERIELPLASNLEALLLPLNEVEPSADGKTWLTLEGQRFSVARLVGEAPACS